MKVKESLAIVLSVLGALLLVRETGWLVALAVLMVAGGFFLYDQLGYKKMAKDVKVIKSKDPRARRG